MRAIVLTFDVVSVTSYGHVYQAKNAHTQEESYPGDYADYGFAKDRA
jgi:hypothetical protein